METKAILFDFGGTLDNDGTDWFTRLHRCVVASGEEVEWNAFQGHASAAADYITTLRDTCELTMDGIVQRLIDRIHTLMTAAESNGGPSWLPEQVASEFFVEAQGYLRRNRDVLTQLAQRFRLGCISNNWGNTQGWCRDAQLDQFFDTMIDSTVVGASKPNELIFQTALDDLKLPAHRCAYVGDKFEADIVGAAAAGLMSIWMTGPEPKQCPDPSLVDYRIETLDELLTIDFKAN